MEPSISSMCSRQTKAVTSTSSEGAEKPNRSDCSAAGSAAGESLGVDAVSGLRVEDVQAVDIDGELERLVFTRTRLAAQPRDERTNATRSNPRARVFLGG